MAPAALITVLEELIAENLLSPLPARRMEEAILARVTCEGTWQ
jgi:hypothetical protein